MLTLVAVRTVVPRWLPFCILGVALAACQGDEVAPNAEGDGGGEACLTNEEFFLREVWGPVMSGNCMACHNAQGAARYSDLVLLPDSQPGFIQINMSTLQSLSQVEIAGTPVLLLKPTGGADHGGGPQIAEHGAEYEALAELITRFGEPVICEEELDDGPFVGVIQLDELQTLRRASEVLVGRLPTPEEEALVGSEGEEGLRTVLARMMNEDAFFGWLQVVFNDLLLTDRYVDGNQAVDLLDREDFPSARWHFELEDGRDSPALIEAAERYTNISLAREALNLITYVVRNERPFTEIVTADYRLVNPFTARTYGIDDVDFEDPLDPTEFREGRLDGVPTAGILTSPMFLNRFPTTATNRNRHRSRMVYEIFLATDVLRLGERPLDPTSIEDFNPTLYNPDCTVCHAVVDPLAGAFQNWDAMGRYRPPEGGWYPEMAPPGFGESTVPHADRLSSLEWLGEHIASDRRFATAAVHNMYRGLTGQEPLFPPSDPEAEDYQVRLLSYDAQRGVFDAIAQRFVDDDYNLKTVIRELVLSPYFRAADLDPIGLERVASFDDLGTGRLLPPELLNRRIRAVLGYPWRDNPDSQDYLLREYRIFYGGIDSLNVVDRIVEPNGLIANIGLRMATEMACQAVPLDFTEGMTDRSLFPFVEPTYEPTDVNGFIIDEAVDAIRQNIVYLHQHILGERLALSDPEVDRTYQLFFDTWKEGRAGMTDDDETTIPQGEWLPWSCHADWDPWTGGELPEEVRIETDPNFTIRAWMAVVTYLLADYRFLYQ